MKQLLLYLFTFIFAYLFYLVFVLKREKVLSKFPSGKEMTYLKFRYGIKINEKNLKPIAHKVILANSFILATTVLVVSLFKSFILGILVSLIPLILLILVCYDIIGKYYKKKQGGK